MITGIFVRLADVTVMVFPVEVVVRALQSLIFNITTFAIVVSP
jgi:hypothetical protein